MKKGKASDLTVQNWLVKMSAAEVYQYLVDNGQTDEDAQSGAAYEFWLNTLDRIPINVLKFQSLNLLSEYVSSVYKK